MTPPVPEVDYGRTSRRPAFDTLPAAVSDAVTAVAGSAVAGAHVPVGSGFGGAFAGAVELADGRTVFVKAAGPSTPHVLRALRRESELLPGLVGLACTPRMLGRVDVESGGGWRVLVLDLVEGTRPGDPWTPQDVAAAYDACREIAATPAPVVQGLGLATVRDELAGATASVPALRRLAEGSQPWPRGHAVPDRAATAEMVRLASRVLDAVHGDALTHLDLRPDNLLREPDGRMRVVDWNQAAVGPAWFDLVTLWPLMHHHGIDLTDLERSPLLEDAADDDVDAVLAFLVGFMLEDLDAPPPPGCTEALRGHALFFSDTTTRLLAHRRGWSLTG
ncbi:phosphotransferase family protein [Phycicoccus sp. DTK01]|uniref:phosphotransferase family protein n=1 Tax=Phycicoccus sp. DTK01 TaxID=2785745 RepID=UPI001A8EC1E4|nr:aminoglycoside phosphotransferase family protein [Phycicoccus sp. DTK01]